MTCFSLFGSRDSPGLTAGAVSADWDRQQGVIQMKKKLLKWKLESGTPDLLGTTPPSLEL